MLVSHEKLETVFGEGDSEIAKYKLVLNIPGTYSRKVRKESVRQMKKQANFPGFRKGDIPPFIRKDIDGFVLNDSVDDMVKEACNELKMKCAEGEANVPQFDMEELKARFQVGTDCEFECTVVLEQVETATDVEVSAKEVDSAVA